MADIWLVELTFASADFDCVDFGSADFQFKSNCRRHKSVVPTLVLSNIPHIETLVRRSQMRPDTYIFGINRKPGINKNKGIKM
jgi:hypothetical protein